MTLQITKVSWPVEDVSIHQGWSRAVWIDKTQGKIEPWNQISPSIVTTEGTCSSVTRVLAWRRILIYSYGCQKLVSSAVASQSELVVDDCVLVELQTQYNYYLRRDDTTLKYFEDDDHLSRD